MKVKKEYIILAVVIIALSVYLLMRSPDRTQYQLPDVAPVAANEISRLQITRDQAIIVITKKDDNWYIAPEDHPADGSKVKEMLTAIETLTLTALVSESKNYNRYDLNPEKVINVRAWQGEILKRDVDLGKAASSFRHTFVKRAADERVYHARGNFRNIFDLTADDLRDKRVLALNAADIQQIQVARDQQSLTLNKTQTPVVVEGAQGQGQTAAAPPEAGQPVWQAADGRPVDESAVKQLLALLSDLRCQRFFSDRQKDDFTSPLLTLNLKGTQDYSLSIFAKTAEKDSDYPATSSGSPYPFLLSDSQVERIMKDPIKAAKPPAETDVKTSNQF